MNKMQIVISVAFLSLSIILFVLSCIILAKKPLLRKYARAATLFYFSGTALIFIVNLFRHDLQLKWTIISEVLVFLVYGLTMANILFIVNRFERSAGVPSAQMEEQDKTETLHSDEMVIEDKNQ